MPPPAEACVGKTVPPRCGRTVVVAAAAPGNLRSTDTMFDVSVFLYLGLAEFPPGSGSCPPGPFETDIDVTVTCTPGGDGGGAVVDVPIALGYNPIDIPVTLAAGPPRSCAITVEATADFGSSTVTATNDRLQVCLVEPLPADPILPRLDLQLLGPDGVARVHPGDESSHTYRITNRDATASFTGLIEVGTENVAKVPGSTGIVGPADGVFSAADPGPGDSFPIAFADEVLTCVPLPSDPLGFLPPLIDRNVQLAPGEFIDVEILTRPWGMCAEGSCSQSTIRVDGQFSDLDSALACAPFATFADLGTPPSFAWTDAGSSALFLPPPDPQAGALPFQVMTQPTVDPALLLGQLGPPMLILPGEAPIQGQPVADQLDPERGRFRAEFQLPIALQPGDPFEVVMPIQIQPDPGGDVISTQLIGLLPMPDAPTGFEELQPSFMGQLHLVQPPLLGPPLDPVASLLDLTLQVSAFGLDPGGQPIDPLGMAPQPFLVPPGANGLELAFQGLVLDASAPVQRIAVDLDLRAHGSAGIPPNSLLRDDFERGNLDGWSAAVGD